MRNTQRFGGGGKQLIKAKVEWLIGRPAFEACQFVTIRTRTSAFREFLITSHPHPETDPLLTPPTKLEAKRVKLGSTHRHSAAFTAEPLALIMIRQ
jgi:hypothetical protein